MRKQERKKKRERAQIPNAHGGLENFILGKTLKATLHNHDEPAVRSWLSLALKLRPDRHCVLSRNSSRFANNNRMGV